MTLPDLRTLAQAAHHDPAQRATLHRLLLGQVAPQIEAQPHAAAALLRDCAMWCPGDALIHGLLGEALAGCREWTKAEHALQHALSLQPRLEPARLRLAELMLQRADAASAARVIAAQDATSPNLRARWIEAAAAADCAGGWAHRLDAQSPLAEQCNDALSGVLAAPSGAASACVTAIAEVMHPRSDGARQAPGLRVQLAEALALPRLAESTEHLVEARARYTQGLERIVAQWTPQRLATLQPSLQHLSWSNFLLAYQGMDDLALQSRYGDWLAQAAATLRPDLPLRAPPAGRRPRVALVSGHWYGCTAGWYFARWIDAVAALDAEAWVIAVGAQRDAFSEDLARRHAHFRHVPGDADAIATALHDLAPDLILYPELGMHTDLLPVAALRLAPRQWVGWGHPVTSGLPTIDRYLSCAPMEPAAAQRHYREPLHLLPGIGTQYPAPPAPVTTTRGELGLPEGPLLLVPQSFYKIHPANDPVYRELLQREPRLRIAFIATGNLAEAARLRSRITRHLGRAEAARILFLPFLSRTDLLRVMSVCDAMLDTLHWSGGNTALDALRAGLPIITTAGEFMRGRQSLAMLDALGVSDRLVTTPERLVDHTLDLLGQHELAALRPRIAAGYDELVDGRAALAALRACVATALALE